MTQQHLSDSFLALSRAGHPSVQQHQTFQLNNKTQVTIHGPGVIEFEPESAGQKSLIYSCGIHGNETAPIEICDRLVQGILEQSITLAHRLLVIFGNLPAMDTATRFIEENMNRLFCGAHSDGKSTNPERQRAAFLEACVDQFYQGDKQGAERIHYDLHTAIRSSKNEKFAVYPFLHGKPYSVEQLAFMAACGVKTILLSQSPTTTFSYHSSLNHNAHAFTVELGKVKPFGENERARFADAEKALLTLAVADDFRPEVNMEDILLYTVNQVVLKSQEDFALHFDDDTPNFTDFPKGTVLATEAGNTFEAQYDGEAIVFPNAQVAIGQRALLTVIPTALDAL